MKLVNYRFNEATLVGQWDEKQHQVRPLLDGGNPIGDLLTLIKEPALFARCRLGEPLPLDAVKLQAPIPAPARNIMCVGKNYRTHVHEVAHSGFHGRKNDPADAIPEFPIVFTKSAHAVIASGEKVWSGAGVTEALDYEAELAVIIGKPGRGISKADAMAHVWGYTIVNDVTARDWQNRHKQWFLGKSFDTFCPMGPLAVTADEVDGSNLDVKCWINGELRQDANTRDLIFDIPTLIATISAGITLYPGDIIATGTPGGVGMGFHPPKFLKSGDVMAIEIQGLGRLENQVQ